MLIFELIKPGVFIKHESREIAYKFEELLNYIEFAFYDANISLNLFEYEMNKRAQNRGLSNQEWRNDFQKRRNLEGVIRKELDVQPHENHELVRFEVDIRLKKEYWQNGGIPLSHQHQLVFLHAKSFLYALDTIDKFLKVISQEVGAPQKIGEIHAKISKEFPNLRGVRNSSQHLEDRARGLGAGNPPKPLNLQPINNGFGSSPQGALMLNNLWGSKFGSTMSDGHYGEVDVSPESMSKIQLIIEQVYESFEWYGSRQHLPN